MIRHTFTVTDRFIAQMDRRQRAAFMSERSMRRFLALNGAVLVKWVRYDREDTWEFTVDCESIPEGNRLMGIQA